MKAPNIHLIVMTISPAVLLLGQCAPTGGTQPEAAQTFDSPVLRRLQVFSYPMTVDPLGISFNGERSGPSEIEPSGMIPGDPPVKEPEESDAAQLAPMVVTGSPVSDGIIDEWPANVIDAELKSSWISPKQLDPPRRHPTEDSVSEWMRSIRR